MRCWTANKLLCTAAAVPLLYFGDLAEYFRNDLAFIFAQAFLENFLYLQSFSRLYNFKCAHLVFSRISVIYQLDTSSELLILIRCSFHVFVSVFFFWEIANPQVGWTFRVVFSFCLHFFFPFRKKQVSWSISWDWLELVY